MTTLLAALQSSRYAATPVQLEQLAASVVTGEQSRGVYLQTLIAATQAALGKRKRVAQADALAALEAAYKPSYAAVQRGATFGQPVSDRTLSQRCGFARTSASALRNWIKLGGDVRTLVPGQVSRRQLRPEAAAPAGTTGAERTMLLALARVIRVAERAAGKEAAAGRQLLEQTVEALSERLDAMADGNTHTSTGSAQPAEISVLRHRLERVSSGQSQRM